MREYADYNWSLRGNLLAAFSPADVTTYYFGPVAFSGLTPFTFPFYGFGVPKDIILTDVVLTKHVNGTAGSLEPSTFNLIEIAPVPGQLPWAPAAPSPAFRTRWHLSSSLVFNDSYYPVQPINDKKIHLQPGKLYVYEWVTPTWATNPTSIYLQVDAYGYYIDPVNQF